MVGGEYRINPEEPTTLCCVSTSSRGIVQSVLFTRSLTLSLSLTFFLSLTLSFSLSLSLFLPRYFFLALFLALSLSLYTVQLGAKVRSLELLYCVVTVKSS